jgi:Family of unknown function (DUF5984)
VPDILAELEMDTFTIAFELRPLADVAPWGTPESGLSIHWFGLTDGWYDVVIDERHLFRVEGGDARGVGYQVVRLWEDLIEVVPAVIDESPADLASRLADVDRWNAWFARAWELENVDELQDVGLAWWSRRRVSTGHLRGAPHLYLWRHGEVLHVHWRSRPLPGAPFWSSPHGNAVLTFDAFIDELVRFDRTLIEAMAARVDSIATAWDRSEIAIDVDQLRREHDDRATWLAQSMRVRHPTMYSWNEVVEAVTKLEDLIGTS